MFKFKKEKGLALSQSKGFTLLELLVVIGIIGLLASIVVVNLTGARKRARDTKRIGDIRGIQTALEDYYGQKGEYPSSIGDLVSGGQLAQRPTDPLATTPCADAAVNGSACYFYAYFPLTGVRYSYHLGADLEDSGSLLLNQDRDCVSTGTITKCPQTTAYQNGFSGADATGCISTVTNRYCYDIAQ